MAAYDVFFFVALFFLIGVCLASFQLGFLIVIIAAVIALIFCGLGFWRKNKKYFRLAILVFFILPGALYFSWRDQNFKSKVDIVFNKEISFNGVVIDNPIAKNSSQEFYLALSSPLSGNILVRTDPYPLFHYGDKIAVQGKIQAPIGPYAGYLAKEGISGLTVFSSLKLIGRGYGSPWRGWLYGIKNNIVSSFERVLPGPEAAFLSGLTLGGTSGFSEDFKRAMSLSGTTHLVALSGYNITIVVWAVMSFMLLFFKKRSAFIMTSFVIVGFVLMTGAESSVVRAAIMAFLVLLATEAGRVYDVRNAIIFTGLLMVLLNPKILVFDIGFELSFLAMLGLVYLKPVFGQLFHLENKDNSFLSWRGNLLTTASAQLMVAPLLIANFNNFSLTSLLANVLVLELVPLTMALGFLLAAASLVVYSFPLIISWFVWPMLKFEMLVIQLFAKLSWPLSFEFSLLMGLFYYSVISFLVIYVNKRIGRRMVR